MSAKRTHMAPQLVDVKDAPSEALARLRNGDPAAALALLRRGEALGAELGAELAELVAKTIKRPRGRPKASPAELQIQAALAVFFRIAIEHVKEREISRSHLDAIAFVAEMYRMTEGRLKHLAWPEGEAAQIAKEMDARDCYIWLPWVRDAIDRLYAEGELRPALR